MLRIFSPTQSRLLYQRYHRRRLKLLDIDSIKEIFYIYVDLLKKHMEKLQWIVRSRLLNCRNCLETIRFPTFNVWFNYHVSLHEYTDPCTDSES